MLWVKRIGLVIVAIVVLFFVVGALLPNSYRVERSVRIAAGPEQVHALVGDLNRWDEWTTWKEDDPTVEVTLGQQTTGVGATQAWTSANGDGRLVFTESSVESGIAYDMAFVMSEGGEEVPARTTMRYVAAGNDTEVVWKMEGEMPVPVLGGYLALVLPASIGDTFDRGLAKLKAKAEAEPLPIPGEDTTPDDDTVDEDPAEEAEPAA